MERSSSPGGSDPATSGPRAELAGFTSIDEILDQACKVMHLARELAIAWFRDQRSQFLEERSESNDYRAKCKQFYDMVLELSSVAVSNHSDLAPLRPALIRAALTARGLPRVFEHPRGERDFSDLAPEMNSISAELWTAVEACGKLQQAKDPFDFLDKLATSDLKPELSAPIAETTILGRDVGYGSDPELASLAELPASNKQQVSPDPLSAPAFESDEKDSPEVSIASTPLSIRGREVLVAMLELKAFDSDTRQTTEQIAERALGKTSDANALKGVMAELKNRNLIDSKTGRGGGCWLTEQGRVRSEKLRTSLK